MLYHKHAIILEGLTNFVRKDLEEGGYMRIYQNKNGQSGVEAFELLPYGIRIRFVGGGIYLYTNESAGERNIEKMRKLAVKGEGLSTFISRNIKDRFSEKES